MKKLSFLFAFIATVSFTQVNAQSAKPDTATKNFITQASIGNLQEIAAGKLAVEKASDPQVKAYGSRMVADHTKAQEQLLQVVKAQGLQLAPQATGSVVPDPMLKNASGASFDKMYVHMMVPDHRKTVLMFQTYAISGKNPAVKSFAQQTLPTLKEHLASIKTIDNKLTALSAK